jgi:hypothetical protein
MQQESNKNSKMQAHAFEEQETNNSNAFTQ